MKIKPNSITSRVVPYSFLTLLALPALTQSCTSDKEETKPNILFILSDDHTSQAWGIYEGILSPYIKNQNIKRLASEGCVLDNCFCTNSISVPSRATIMTGAYSHVNGVKTLSDALSPDKDNIAKRLSGGGYQTALIGKWHLKKEPTGFDYYSVFHDQGDYINPTFKTKENWIDDDKGNNGIQENGFSTDLVTSKVMNWLSNRDKKKPFFMCCHFKATHEPWDFPERMKHLYDGVTFPEPESLYEFDSIASNRTFAGQQLENLAWRWETASTGDWWCKYPELPFKRKGVSQKADRKQTYQKFIKDYLRCGATIDDNIGKLLKYLDDNNLAENTIVVYVSDQGYFLGEHGFFDKRIMYEEPLHMPFVIRYPREIPKNTRNKDIILNVDFASLLADYGKVDAPNLAQGKSFRENLKGKTPVDWRKAMYYRYWTQHKIRPAHFGIRNERYKLIFFYGDKLDSTDSEEYVSEPSFEFYDLKTDPHENHNAYHDKKYASIIKQMKKDLLIEKDKVKDSDENYPKMTKMIKKYF